MKKFKASKRGRKKEARGRELRVHEQRILNEFGDGVAWSRGGMIGKGSSASVFVATLKNYMTKYGIYPSLMAVKSAEISASVSIQKEREVLCNLKGSPYVIRCFGEETTRGAHGEMIYNLLLEFSSGGTLADMIKKSGRSGIPELKVRYYTRSILRGLKHIHDCGYVHCDLKPHNILLARNRLGSTCDFTAKIGDLGLAKRANSSKKRKLDPYPVGTPQYWSPETSTDGIQGPPSDVWALGLIVLEMLTGKPLDAGEEEHDSDHILYPTIPSEVSEEGKGFLNACFEKKVDLRFTAEMLLLHPFVQGLTEDRLAGEVGNISVIDETYSFLILTDTSMDDELSSDEKEYRISDKSLSCSAEVTKFQSSKIIDLKSTSNNAGFDH